MLRFGCGALVGALLLGASLPASAELKIGFVNAAALLQGSPQAEAVQKKLRDEFSPRRREIEAKQAKIKQTAEDLQKNGMLLSDEQRAQREREVVEGQRELKYAQDKFEDDLRLRQQDEVGRLRGQLLGAVEAYAKEAGYDLILYEGVIYAKDTINVTGKVLEVLKTKPASVK